VEVDVATANTDWAGRPRPSKLKRKNTPHPSTMMGNRSEGVPKTEGDSGSAQSKGRKGTSLDAGSSSSSSSSSSSKRGGDSSARKPGAKSRPSGGIQFDLPTENTPGSGEKQSAKSKTGSAKAGTKSLAASATAATSSSSKGGLAATESKKERVAAARQRREEQQRARAQRLSGSSQVSSSARTSRTGLSSKRTSGAGSDTTR